MKNNQLMYVCTDMNVGREEYDGKEIMRIITEKKYNVCKLESYGYLQDDVDKLFLFYTHVLQHADILSCIIAFMPNSFI